MEFYDVKSKQKVDVPESQIKKTTYTRQTKEGKTSTRYAVKANHNGTHLTKFVSKEDYDKLNVPIDQNWVPLPNNFCYSLVQFFKLGPRGWKNFLK